MEENLAAIGIWSFLIGCVLIITTPFTTLWLLWNEALIKRLVWPLIAFIAASGIVLFAINVAFRYGGCFESCTGKIEDEVGLIIASTIIIIYSAFVIIFCIHKKHITNQPNAH